MRLGVLDQSPLRSGATPEEALGETVELARRTEALGYDRFWVAEHHGSEGLMGSAPEVLIARIAAATLRIRVGSGGVMLMHYSPYKVAEQFRVLEALFPGRIDLGIGRAPGSDAHTAAALAYGNQIGMEYFAAKVADLVAWTTGAAPHTTALARVRVSPAGNHHPQFWLLGSTDQSAQLAAHLGLRFAFAHFIAPDPAARVLALYRDRFRPSASLAQPEAALAVFALCAEDPREAEDLARCRDLWRQRLASGAQPGPWPTVDEARAMTPTLDTDGARRHAIAGTPDVVSERIRTLGAETGVDEALVVTITPTFEQRVRSYALLGEAFGLGVSRDRPDAAVDRQRVSL
jgi:luciferase family oxidoreductase group 1